MIAVDGTAVCGAKDQAGKAPHLVAARAHGIGAVLGQVAVTAKSNEIPAVRELLKAFTDLAGAVITIDALHTQADTAQAILARRADYVMTVKGNMPTPYRQLKKLPWAAVPATSAVSTDHGRRARRTIKAALVPAWVEFAGAAQVAQVRHTVTKKGKKTAGNPFRHLAALREPDKVYVYTRTHRYEYAVQSERVVRYTDVSVEAPVPGHPGQAPGRARITLITCTPVTLEFTPWRIVVTGQLVRTVAWHAG